MNLTRREFFVGLLWGVLALGSGRLRASENTPSDRATLLTFVDTLLPADAFSPAASAVGVADVVYKWFSATRGRRVLLRNGCAWLNAQAGGDFAALTDDQRERIVVWMMESPRSQGPRVFYERTRQEAVTAYYALPLSWQGMAISHPPQPRGYAEELFALDRAND